MHTEWRKFELTELSSGPEMLFAKETSNAVVLVYNVRVETHPAGFSSCVAVHVAAVADSAGQGDRRGGV